MKTLLSGVAVAAALLAASTAAAQEAGRPAHSLSVRVAASPAVGVWTRVAPGADFGLEVGLSRGDHDDDSSTGISVSPGLKLFTRADGPVWPYVFAGARLERQEQAMGDASADVTSWGGQVGFGVDWYPADRLSVGGHVGLGAARTEGDVLPQLGGPEADVWEIGTFRSGIRIHFYF